MKHKYSNENEHIFIVITYTIKAKLRFVEVIKSLTSEHWNVSLLLTLELGTLEMFPNLFNLKYIIFQHPTVVLEFF